MIETGREVVGTSGRGEVTIITKLHNAGVADDGATINTEERFSVRQGGVEVLETNDQARARAVAEALVSPDAAEKPKRVKRAESAAESEADGSEARARLTK
jgi:hypothetical protein